jgi:pyroglutamyl-peptidase
MTARLRVLVTGFKPFPGAPWNPTEPLVERLVRLRRPAFSEVDITSHVFRVSYGTINRELPALLAARAPDALLMFGLAQRTPYLRVETRARNAVSQLWPDADHALTTARMIARDASSFERFGPHTALLREAAQATGVTTRLSRDAGRYLCNYISWQAIAASRRGGGRLLTAFVHVPTVAHPPASRPSPSPSRVSFENLVDAGEALLLTMVKLARQRAHRCVPHQG